MELYNTRIICIINFKGGVGKTTTAVNLAAYLAYNNKKTLLVDMDPQSSATYHFWSHSNYNSEIKKRHHTIAHLLFRAGKEMSYDIQNYIKQSPWDNNENDFLSNLYIIPGDNDCIKLDQALNNCPIILDSILNPLRDNFHYIIIDSPPVMYSVIRNNILASDYYIVPTIPDLVSTSGIRHLLETLQSYFNKFETLIRDRKAQFLGVLFTRFGGLNIAMHRKYFENTRNDFLNGAYVDCGSQSGENKVFKSIIRERIDVQKAAELQLPLILYDRNGDVSVDYLRFAKEIIETLES